MKFNVNVKRRIVFNGKEYDSIAELPENARRALEEAAAASPPPDAPDAHPGAKIKIMFNGHEYASVEAMPAAIRRLYESALAAVESGAVAGQVGEGFKVTPTAPGREATTAGGVAVSAEPIVPGEPKPWPWRQIFTIVLAVALLTLLLFLRIHRPGYH
jgi:hypothetical protein